MRNDVALFQKAGSVIDPVKKPSIKTNIGGLLGGVYHFGPDRRDYFVLTARVGNF
jgi:hypothetical protein